MSGELTLVSAWGVCRRLAKSLSPFLAVAVMVDELLVTRDAFLSVGPRSNPLFWTMRLYKTVSPRMVNLDSWLLGMLQVNRRDACGPGSVGLPEHLGRPHGAQVWWQEVTQPGCQRGCGQGRDSTEAWLCERKWGTMRMKHVQRALLTKDDVCPAAHGFERSYHPAEVSESQCLGPQCYHTGRSGRSVLLVSKFALRPLPSWPQKC